MTSNSSLMMSNTTMTNSEEVVCTPTILFPALSALDARQTFSGFVTQSIPVSNQSTHNAHHQQPLLKFTKGSQHKNKHDSNTQTAQLVTSAITPTLTNHTITIQHQSLQNSHLMQNGQTNKFASALMLPSNNSHHLKAVTQHLNTNGEVAWSCPSCKIACKSATELQNHLSVHTKTEKSVPCNQCGKLFASQERVKTHIKVAHGNKSAVCQICGSSFSYKCKLADHMRTHTGEKPFVCDICGRQFSQKNHVRRHKMIHTGERPHSCPVCGKGFYRKDKLSRHRLIHLNPLSRKNKQSATINNNQSNNNSNVNNSSLNLNAVTNGSLISSELIASSNSLFQTNNSTVNDSLINANNGTATIQLIPVQLTAQQWISAQNNLNSNMNNNHHQQDPNLNNDQSTATSSC